MAGRRALYLMPSFAVLATAALVLGPGRERPAIGARVWGIPAEGANVAAWRIETIERQYGADRALAIDPLEVSVLLAGRRLGAWAGASGEDGVAEALIQTDGPLSGPFEVRVTSGRLLLGAGTLPQKPAAPLARETRTAEGTSTGPIALRVDIDRGVLASPFPGSVHVTATRDGEPAGSVVLNPTATGAEIPLPGIETMTSVRGEASIAIVPTWHAVDLKIEAVDRRAKGEPKSMWEGSLPVQAGALFLRDSQPTAEVFSPVPRDRVYVSALGSTGRVFGDSVILSRNDKGLYQGVLDTSQLLRLGAQAVTLAGDPEERGSGTVTWPLFSTVGFAAVPPPPRLEVLLDGVPFAERREQARALQARLASVGVALLAALLEAILLVLYSRESQQKLAAHLAQLSEDEGERAAASRMMAAPASRAITLVVTVGLVVLGFGAVAAFAIVR